MKTKTNYKCYVSPNINSSKHSDVVEEIGQIMDQMTDHFFDSNINPAVESEAYLTAVIAIVSTTISKPSVEKVMNLVVEALIYNRDKYASEKPKNREVQA